MIGIIMTLVAVVLAAITIVFLIIRMANALSREALSRPIRFRNYFEQWGETLGTVGRGPGFISYIVYTITGNEYVSLMADFMAIFMLYFILPLMGLW